jgi:hypothetical protein
MKIRTTKKQNKLRRLANCLQKGNERIRNDVLKFRPATQQFIFPFGSRFPIRLLLDQCSHFLLIVAFKIYAEVTDICTSKPIIIT